MLERNVVMSGREEEAKGKTARNGRSYSSLLRFRICLEIGEMSRSVENPSELDVEMLEAAE